MAHQKSMNVRPRDRATDMAIPVIERDGSEEQLIDPMPLVAN